MKILKNMLDIKLNLRTQQNFPINGVEFIDINPLILQGDVYNEIIDKIYDELKDKQIDYIVSPEARGFVFGSIIANKLGIGMIPVRKQGKIPPNHVECSFESEKEYGKDILELPKLVNNDYKNKNIYIIDDIYATGNTIKSIANALNKMNAKVVGIGVVINIKNLNLNEGIFSLIDIEEE